jgi:hypothetical protein
MPEPASVNQLIPEVAFRAMDRTGHDVIGVKVAIDGVQYTEPLDGRAFSLDPGEHEFRFDVSGHEPVVRRFVLQQGEQSRRETILLNDGLAAGEPGNGLHHSSDVEAPSGLPAKHIVALTLGGAALLGLGAGGAFGLLASSAWSSAKAVCGGNPSQCNATNVSVARSYQATATSDSTVATVGGIVGGAALVTGAVLFFTERSSERRVAPRAGRIIVAPNVGIGSAGIALTGDFE